MRKSLLIAAVLPMLTACEEIAVPFVLPVDIPLDAVSDQGPDGLFRLNAASEAMSLDDVRAELPSAYQGVTDFTVTNLTLSDPGSQDVRDPEYDEVRDPEYDEVRDPEYDELSDFAVNAAVYISLDEWLDDSDRPLAFVNEFANDQAHYEAEVTEYAELGLYEEGSFHVIVTATFNEAPPTSLTLPMLIAGNGSLDPLQALSGG